MKNIYILIFVGLLLSCSSKKNQNSSNDGFKKKLEKEAEAIEILEKDHGFVDVSINKNHNGVYYKKNDRGLVFKIRLSNKGYSKLPKEVYDLKNITRIDLRNSNFTDIPASITEFTELTELMIPFNPIKKIKNLELPNSLNEIRLDECPLEKFPHFTKENDSIPYRLFLPDTFIDSIPDFVGDMNLKTLWLQRCPITYISPKLGNCENMEELQFEANPFLKEFPKELAKLKKMEIIRFDWLPIRKIPDFVFEWPELYSIHIENSMISEIPSKIGNLKKLRFLYAEGNNVRTLPEELGKVPNIEFIDFDGCPIDISSIPAGFFPERDLPQKKLPTLYLNAPNCYDCFSVPEEQVRKSYRLL